MSLLSRIQESDDGTKWWIAVGIFIVSAAIVMILWFAYLGSILSQPSEAVAREKTGAQEFSLLTSVKKQTASIYHGITGTVKRILLSPKDYEIKPN